MGKRLSRGNGCKMDKLKQDIKIYLYAGIEGFFYCIIVPCLVTNIIMGLYSIFLNLYLVN